MVKYNKVSKNSGMFKAQKNKYAAHALIDTNSYRFLAFNPEDRVFGLRVFICKEILCH